MALLALVAFAALHLERDDLLAARMLDELSGDTGSCNVGCADTDVGVLTNCQYMVEQHSVAGVAVESFNIYDVAR